MGAERQGEIQISLIIIGKRLYSGRKGGKITINDLEVGKKEGQERGEKRRAQEIRPSVSKEQKRGKRESRLRDRINELQRQEGKRATDEREKERGKMKKSD